MIECETAAQCEQIAAVQEHALLIFVFATLAIVSTIILAMLIYEHAMTSDVLAGPRDDKDD